ncbi:transposase [Streptomyces rimosus]|uniref:transposase n=1 Tax=Streptomyces rimosus TaxID=1927 RepID=UPI0018FEC885
MLPDPTVPASLLAGLSQLRGCFTAPSFVTFTALVTGLIAQTGRRTVTGMLLGVALSRLRPHDRAHTSFSRAARDPDLLGISCSHLIARCLLAPGEPLVAAVDDTLFKRSGKKVFGTGWQHDGAAKGPKPVGRGTCFVILGLIVTLPLMARPVCLPVMCRLWRPGGTTTKVELAAAMIRKLAACHWRRRVHVVADAAYHGHSLRDLPDRVTFTTRLPKSAVLYDPPHLPRAARAAPAEGRAARGRGRHGCTSGLPHREGGPLPAPRAGPSRRDPLPVVRLLPHPARPCPAHPRQRPGHEQAAVVPGHHRLDHPGRATRHPVRVAVVHRGHLCRSTRTPRCGPGPGPRPPRGRADLTLRDVLLHDHRPLVRPARPPPRRRRRVPASFTLVRHQDPAALRGHDRQAPPRDRRRQDFRPRPRSTHRRRNPSRPTRLGRSRHQRHRMTYGISESRDGERPVRNGSVPARGGREGSRDGAPASVRGG